MLDDVYYRIIKNSKTEGKWVVVTMQWFDEKDYDQEAFYNDEQYENEEEAEFLANILNKIPCIEYSKYEIILKEK